MKKEEKLTPHIIAAAALVVFIVLGLACATAQKPSVDIVYDASIPEDQTAALYINPGMFEVFDFDGIPLNPHWYQPSLTGPGMNVKIPAGRHNIGFNYYSGSHTNANNNRLSFNAVAGRNYVLYASFITGNASNRTQTVLFDILEGTQNRDLGLDEQFLTIKLDGLSVNIVLDKDTDNERKFRLLQFGEIRIIVSKDVEHTIDVEMTPTYIADWGNNVEPVGDRQGRFTASSEPVRYDLKLGTSGVGKNTKTTYTLTRK